MSKHPVVEDAKIHLNEGWPGGFNNVVFRRCTFQYDERALEKLDYPFFVECNFYECEGIDKEHFIRMATGSIWNSDEHDPIIVGDRHTKIIKSNDS